MRKCKVDGCNRDHAAKGFCKTHYQQFWKGKIPGEIRVRGPNRNGCLVDGCSNKHSGKGYCNKHRLQIQLFGFIKERTTRDPNEFIFEKDICKIILYNIRSEPIDTAIIDVDDYDKVRGVKWHKESGRGYPKSRKKGYLHHVIWGEKAQLDQRDCNKMNARKSNLRLATRKQNAQNKLKQKRNKSGYIGVRFSRRLGKFRAQIFIDGKNRHLGLFQSILEAARAYDFAALKQRGRFARLNF